MSNGMDWLFYILLVILIAFSAYFSSSETAISTVSKMRLRHYAEQGNSKAKKALYISDNYDKAISTILIGNNIVNITASSIATMLAVRMLGEAGTVVSTIMMTILILTFGEVLPKALAKDNSEKLALAFSPALFVLMRVFSPLVYLFVKLKWFVARLTKSGNNSPTYTEQELKYLVQNIEQEGVLEQQEGELVKRALEFDERTVQEILTPRVDVIAIDINDDIKQISSLVLSQRFARLPVYEGDMDNIVGVLHTRDFLHAMACGKSIQLKEMLQPAAFVYRTKKLSSLLNDFKRSQQHLAVVTDEYGGTMGIVTMEDLLEQLVGDIWDEDEQAEANFVALPDGSFSVNGEMNTLEVFENIQFQDDHFSSDSNSIGGWALEMLGHIPNTGESFTYQGLNVTVSQVEEQRVARVKLRLLPQNNGAQPETQP